MRHILNTEEYYEVITVNYIDARNYSTLFEYLEELFQSCMYWQNKIIGVNHFLSIALEKLEKSGYNTSESLDWIYKLKETHDFEIIEGGVGFTDKIFNLSVPNSLNLDEQIIEPQSTFFYE